MSAVYENFRPETGDILLFLSSFLLSKIKADVPVNIAEKASHIPIKTFSLCVRFIYVKI